MPEFDVFYQNLEKYLCFGAQYFSSLFTKMRKSGLNEGEKTVKKQQKYSNKNKHMV